MQGIVCPPWEAQALYEGRLTVVIRPVLPQPIGEWGKFFEMVGPGANCIGQFLLEHAAPGLGCPFPPPGEQFYVKEEHRAAERTFVKDRRAHGYYGWAYRDGSFTWIENYTFTYSGEVDWPEGVTDRTISEWVGAMEMAWHERARTKLEVVSVRVERLQEYIENDAIIYWQEQIGYTLRHWKADNPEFSLRSDPWVWVGEVKRV